MPVAPHRLVRAWLESLTVGIVELDRDWRGARPPQFSIGTHCPAPGGLAPASMLTVGRAFGYFTRGDDIVFLLSDIASLGLDTGESGVYLAGDFNGWQDAVGKPEWRLGPAEINGEKILSWSGPAARFLQPPGQRFKFVTGEHHWLALPDDAANGVRDDGANLNRMIDPNRTGRHIWRFTCPTPVNLGEPLKVNWANNPGAAGVPVVPGRFFFNLKSDLPLGALVRGNETVFRIFAPRALEVTLFFCDDLANQAQPHSAELFRRLDTEGSMGVWEVALDQNLHGWFYWYSIEGARSGTGKFDPTMKILDPYAWATVGREGPGIVVDQAQISAGDILPHPPAWQDLIIAEAHVRDLVANAPVKISPEERRGFTGLRKWVESPEFPLQRLGINCVELQPIQEFDNQTTDEYHWGYMTNNYFSPESSYALAP